MKKNFIIKWYDGDAALLNIKADWERIEKKSTNNVFMTWELINSWWSTFGKNRKLHILVIEIDKKVELILPFQILKTHILGLIPVDHWYNLGCKSSAGIDYLGAIFNSEINLTGEEIKETLYSIKKKGGNAPLHLREFSSSSIPNKESFFSAIKDNYNFYIQEPTYCPSSQLPNTWEDFLNTLSRNFRSQIRRNIKKYDQEDLLKVSQYSSPDEMAEKVQELKRLNTKRISELGKETSFGDEKLSHFLEDISKKLATKKHCMFYQLHYNEISIAIIFLISDKNKTYYLLGGFDDDYKQFSPVNVLFVQAIKDAIEKNHTEFNFLKGQEPYKYRWQATDDINDNIAAVSRGFIPTAAYQIEEFLFRGKRKANRLWNQFTQKP